MNILITGSSRGTGAATFAALDPGGATVASRAAYRGYARDGILAFAICPGVTMTGMADDPLERRGDDKLLADIPLGRVADPREIDEMARWCSLNAPHSMTGAVLDANGAGYVR